MWIWEIYARFEKNGKLSATHFLPLDGAQDEQLGPGLLQQRYLLSNKNDCCKVLIKHSGRLFIDFQNMYLYVINFYQMFCLYANSSRATPE